METGVVFIGADIYGLCASASLFGTLSVIPPGLRGASIKAFKEFAVYTCILLNLAILPGNLRSEAGK